MLTFDAGKILKAVTALRQLEAAVRTFNADQDNSDRKKQPLNRSYCRTLVPMVDEIQGAIAELNTKTTVFALEELRSQLTRHKITITYIALPEWIQDIGITLRRELSLQKTFCIGPERLRLFEESASTFGKKFEIGFASAVFEVDEAGKCYALGRSTACAFHLMRTMEIGIRAVAQSLGIPDPVKPAERNWGSMLKAIRTEFEARDSGKKWNSGDKDFFANAYASLDAVRVAWRNTTMHVENKYTDDEAEHMFVTVRGFMKRLSERMDENGNPNA